MTTSLLRRPLAGLAPTLAALVALTSAEAQEVAAPERPAAAAPAQGQPTEDGARAPAQNQSARAERGRGNGAAQDRAAADHAAPSEAAANRLPPASTTHHRLALPDRTLAFTATIGPVRLFNDKGEPEADIVVTSYQLDGADPKTRPVTFVFNGGPGASSAWLQIGNLGPWRYPMDGADRSPSDPPELVTNAETWLDFTDLVFIDPVGTGYSRFVASGDDVRKRYFSVDGDVHANALVIRRWLERSDRLTSPKFVVGESYGGIRGPKVVRELAERQGIGVRGLMLVSPVVDFSLFSRSNPLHYVASLPSFAAIARAKKGDVTRDGLADVEAYARGEFLSDLVAGAADRAATDRMATRVGELTGLGSPLAHRLAGRIDAGEFRRAFSRSSGEVLGRFDGSLTAPDPFPESSRGRFGDPSLDPFLAPMTSAAVDLIRNRLGWKPEGSFELLSGAVSRAWDWGRNGEPTESVTQIREILATDPKLKLTIAHGLADLAAPYFGSKLVLDQLPAYATPDRVHLVVYPGGHMFYSRDGSRRALRAEAEAMMK